MSVPMGESSASLLPLAPIGSEGFSRPSGDIVTLLDLAPRDYQDNIFYPLSADKTLWLPLQNRRVNPFSICVQQFPFRGPTAFGQRFTFDLKSVSCGDLLFNTLLQIDLGHWFNDTDIMRLESGRYITTDPNQWYYANSLGSVILEKAELEVNDQTIETVDGDFLNVSSLLFQDLNSQYGLATDGLGRQPLSTLLQSSAAKPFPTQGKTLFIPLPFFFSRIKLQEAFPLLACKEGSVRIHITLRPFHECVRTLSGRRVTCDDTPLSKSISVKIRAQGVYTDTTITADSVIPQFKGIQLITHAAHTDGEIRQKILRKPFENLIRNVNIFHFAEPLKYVINKSSSDTINVQLPLEVNNPIEEIIWFVRRKATANNNEWTNYSAVTSPEFDPVYNPLRPLLQSASIQFNGIDIITSDEQWFRRHISLKHPGGISAYDNYIYGYSFSKYPGTFQPSGTVNASRLQSVRLTLGITPPSGSYELEWEVKVFVISLQWLRFQDGLTNKMYMD
jgi:hypothetical protein